MTMKSFVAAIFLFTFVFALTTASGLQTRQSGVLLTCEVKAFVELAEETVSDVYDFYDSAGKSYEELIEDALQCVEDYSDFEDLVSCAADTLTKWVDGFSGALVTLCTDLIALGQELTDDIYNCKPSSSPTTTTTAASIRQ